MGTSDTATYPGSRPSDGGKTSTPAMSVYDDLHNTMVLLELCSAAPERLRETMVSLTGQLCRWVKAIKMIDPLHERG